MSVIMTLLLFFKYIRDRCADLDLCQKEHSEETKDYQRALSRVYSTVLIDGYDLCVKFKMCRLLELLHDNRAKKSLANSLDCLFAYGVW